MTEAKSVTNINYIAENYTQNPINANAISELQGLQSKLRSAEAFNYILLVMMFIGFGF